MSNGVIVEWNGDLRNMGHNYLVDVGYHNDIINLRAFAKEPKPLTLNGKTILNIAKASHIINIIHEQFPHENFEYSISERGQTFPFLEQLNCG